MRRLLLLTLPWLAGLALLMVAQPERDSVTGLQPFPSRLRDEIHEIRDRVSAIRGLPVNDGIHEGTISETDLTPLFQQNFADLGTEFEEMLRNRTDAMRLLHLIGASDDLVSILDGSEGTAGIAGVYFAPKKTLLLVGELNSIDFTQEFVLAHEYIHSFQDRALEHVFVPTRPPFTETSIIGRCLIEGDANAGAEEYMKKVHGSGWRAEALRSQGSAGGPPGTEADIRGTVRYSLFVYSDCAKFVTAIRERAGWEGVNALYSRPPDSTEQILHPEKYFSRESPKPVSHTNLTPALSAGWTQESSEAFGELDLLAYMFGLARNDASSRIAADGWGGGAMSVYGNPVSSGAGDTLVHITIVWDSPEEMAQFRTEYQRALARTLLGSRQTELTSPEWNWQANWREQGHVRWNTHQSQADIILSTSDSAIAVARTFLAPPPAPTIAQYAWRTCGLALRRPVLCSLCSCGF